MTRRTLLLDVGAAPLPALVPIAPVYGAWAPAVYQRPALAAPTALASTPTADAARLTWIATPGARTVIETAPDAAGTPGTWTEYRTVDAQLELLPLAAGAICWVRLRASRNGLVSEPCVAVLATPKIAASQSSVDDALSDINAVRTAVDAINDDGILSRDEKPALIREVQALVDERPGLLLLAQPGDEDDEVAEAVADAAAEYAAALDDLLAYLDTLTNPARWNNASDITYLT